MYSIYPRQAVVKKSVQKKYLLSAKYFSKFMLNN